MLFIIEEDYFQRREIKATEDEIEENFSELIHILKAMNNPEPKERPTAIGVLDYLDGNCEFKGKNSLWKTFSYKYGEKPKCDTETTGYIELVKNY